MVLNWDLMNSALVNSEPLDESLRRGVYDAGWCTIYLMNEGCDNEIFQLPLQDFPSCDVNQLGI